MITLKKPFTNSYDQNHEDFACKLLGNGTLVLMKWSKSLISSKSEWSIYGYRRLVGVMWNSNIYGYITNYKPLIILVFFRNELLKNFSLDLERASNELRSMIYEDRSWVWWEAWPKEVHWLDAKVFSMITPNDVS